MTNKTKKVDFKQRIITAVTMPASHKLNEEDVFDSSGKPRIDRLKKHFNSEGRLTEKTAIRILKEAGGAMRKLPNVLEIKSPLTIVGDIHGQYFDLLKLFDIGGSVDSNQYLFLGDYVDRGCFGIECVLLLFSIKILKGNNFQLLRGNHECRHLTKHFSFKKECKMKYSQEVYNACMEAFDCLPIAAIVDKKFICLHGGLSPEVPTIDDILQLDRFKEPPSYGPLCDILWSDPVEEYDTNETETLFAHNSSRGCSYSFSFHACSKFLKQNNLLSLIRAHEAQDEGFRMYKNCKKSKFPSLITIFSAPNYLDVYENKGAILRYENKKLNIKQFTCVPHPYWLPNFMDVFTWSLPFIAEKTTNMLITMLNICSDEELENEADPKSKEFHMKMVSIAKVANAFSEIREGRESLFELGGITPPHMNPLKLITNKTKKAEHKKIHNFDEARQIDKINEMMPKDER